MDDKELQRAVRDKVSEALRRGYVASGLKGGSGGEPPTSTLTYELSTLPRNRLLDFITTVVDSLVA